MEHFIVYLPCGENALCIIIIIIMVLTIDFMIYLQSKSTKFNRTNDSTKETQDAAFYFLLCFVYL